MVVAGDLGGVSPGDCENIADAPNARGVLIRLHQLVRNNRQPGRLLCLNRWPRMIVITQNAITKWFSRSTRGRAFLQPSPTNC